MFKSKFTRLGIKRMLCMVSFTTLSLGIGFVSHAQIVNDSCSQAISLTANTTCISTAGSTLGATPSDVLSDCTYINNGDVWYQFVATGTSHVVTLKDAVATSPQAYYYYYGLAVYEGNCTALSEINCNSAPGGNPANVLLTSLVIGQTYYVQIFTQGAYDQAYNTVADNIEFNICVSDPPPVPQCATLLAPVAGATDVSTAPTTLSWHATENADYYDLYYGLSPGSAIYATTFDDTVGNVTGLSYSTTYYWYVVPVGLGGEAVGCASEERSFTTQVPPPPPVNDACSNAINVPVGNGFGTTVVTSATVSATTEFSMGSPSCAGYASDDIWFTVTVPASGSVIIQTAANSANEGTDAIMEAYTGTCGVSMVQIGCNDDGNPDDFPSSAHSRISLSGQMPGTTIYIRVLPFSVYSYGPMAITAWDPDVTPDIASSGTCMDAVPVTIDNMSGNLYRWVPIMDVSGKIVAEIYANGNTLGSVNSSLFINSGAVRQANNVYYLDRNVSITPATQPSSVVYVRLYLLQTEVDNLTAMDPSIMSMGDLNISKNGDVCQSAVSAATSEIAQYDNEAYGTTGGYVQFTTASFSSFYLRGGNIPLPIVLKSIAARNMNEVNEVTWTTAQEIKGDYFELERSNDGKSFQYLATINANNKPSEYIYNDRSPLSGINYYRLKLINKDGKINYSKTVQASMNASKDRAVTVYPNPVNKNITIKVQGSENGVVTLSDISGRVISTTKMNGSELHVDMSQLSIGFYLVHYVDDNLNQVIKVNKQ